MQLNYLGGNPTFFYDAFFDVDGNLEADITGFTSTTVSVENLSNGNRTSVFGTGFTANFATGEVTGGTINSMSFFSSSGATQYGNLTGLGWGDHIGRVLNRPRLKQNVPVVLTRKRGEGGGNKEQIGPLSSQMPIELREADVVANGQADAAEPWDIHHWRQAVARLDGCRLLVGVAVG